MTRFGVPGQNIDTLSYADGRLATVPSVQAPRRPTTEDKKFPLWCEWRVNKEATAPAEEGEFWKLIRYESNGDATWVMFGGGGGTGPLVNIETDDGAPNVVPDGFGEVEILGGAGISVTGQGPGNTVTISMSGGGAGIDSVDVDFNTAPGTDPVLPDGAGLITISGNTVANATNLNSPIATHSRAANAYNIEVQVSSDRTGAPGNTNDAGLSSFDDNSFLVDADGYVQSLGGIQPTFSNLGITYTVGTGTFTIHGHDGTALSGSNPGIVWLQDADNPGQLVKYEVTANQSFIDDNGASEIVNNLFGLTTSVAYASDIPFFIYAVRNSDPGTNLEPDIAFMISRIPHRQVAPSVGSIGAPDDAVADTQGSFFSFDNITEADYASQPCLCVGSFRMQMSASDDWTVQTLDVQDGIGEYQEQRIFTVLQATFGAGTASYIQDNGGTAPTFTSFNYTYKIQKDGYCFSNFVISGDGGTDGAGAVATQVIMPFSSALGGNFGIMRLDIAGGGTYCGCEINTGGQVFTPRDVQNTVTTSSPIQNADFVNGTRQLSGYLYYAINT
jgi:hypothetical protein